MKIFSVPRSWCATHHGLAICVAIVLIAALGTGGYYFYRNWQYRQTSEYAFERLQKALSPPDPHELAALVDFRGVGDDLATSIAAAFPFYQAGDDQLQNVSHKVQAAILARLQSSEPVATEPALSEEEALQKPLVALPRDMARQLLDSMQIRQEGNLAYVTARLENPLLSRPFTIVFSMEKGASGWKIRHIVNAKNLGAEMRAALLERYLKQRDVSLRRNALIAKKMDQQLPIVSCTADAGPLSDGKTVLMVVHVMARNHGEHRVNNYTLDVDLTGRNGAQITQRRLNAAFPVSPGEDFDHRWTFDLEANGDLARRVMANLPLQCKASWRTMGVDNGEVLHILDLDHPEVRCPVIGHDHPDGFCEIPIFKD